MTIKELMKEFERANKVNKKYNNNILVLKNNYKYVEDDTELKTYKDIQDFIVTTYTPFYANQFLNTSITIDNDIVLLTAIDSIGEERVITFVINRVRG